MTAFAAAYTHPTLDVLICNAGIMNTPFALSKVILSLSILIGFDCVVSDSHVIAAGRHRTAVPEQSPRPLQARKLLFWPCGLTIAALSVRTFSNAAHNHHIIPRSTTSSPNCVHPAARASYPSPPVRTCATHNP